MTKFHCHRKGKEKKILLSFCCCCCLFLFVQGACFCFRYCSRQVFFVVVCLCVGFVLFVYLLLLLLWGRCGGGGGVL